VFDISFSELALCFVVALVVLGPERLPKVARTVGRWTGHMRAYMRNLTSELERETEVMDLKRQFTEARDAIRESANEFQSSTRQMMNDVQQPVQPADALPPPAASAEPAPTESGTPHEAGPATPGHEPPRSS
jgi:sec-independent protein translocase protein TatB